MSEQLRDNGFEPLDPLLQNAVDAICAAPMCERTIQRIADGAVAMSPQSANSLSISTATRDRRRFSKAMLSGSLAASVLVLSFMAWHLLSPSSAWAQVVEAVSQQPWMRLVLQRPDVVSPTGEEIPNVVMWLDGDRQKAALDAPDGLRWIDLLTSKSYRYTAESGRIRVGSLDAREGEQVLSLMMVLHQFDANPNTRPPSSVRLKNSSRGEVDLNGLTLDEYCFTFEQAGEEASQHTMRVQVDKESFRPVQLVIDRRHQVKDSMPLTFTIDYPQSGPIDIYAMGAPQDTPVDDVHSLAAYFPQAKPSVTTNYHAIELTFLAGREQKFISDAQRFVVGNRIAIAERADLKQLNDLSKKLFYGDSDKVPTGKMPDIEWWATAVNDVKFEQFDASSDTNYPHMRCYAPYGSIDLYDSVHAATLEGLEGTVELRGPRRSTWVDPNRDGIVRRWESLSDDGKISVRQNDEVVQAPNGEWFASRWRSGRVERRGDALTNNAAGVSTSIHICIFEF